MPTESIPPLASDLPLAPPVQTEPSSSSQAESTPTASQTASSQALSNSSSLSTSAVVAACVGAFIGLAILICLFIWWTRHSSTKAKRRAAPRTPVSDHRNARSEQDQQKTRSGMWNKLDEEGHPREMSEAESDEKNFSMFKKRTMSMRTTRTAKALEEHGFDMPPITQYHPDLAKQLALEQPERPFVARQESGVSWDGDTVGDDSFLSLRSVRIESGAMSPTFGVAKMTPPAMPSQLHKWESAEVLTLDESAYSGTAENPFSDVADERRKSASNPFFSAGDVHRSSSRRSRSNSRGHSHSRNTSKSRRSVSRSQVASQISSASVDPFADEADPSTAMPTFTRTLAHAHTDSNTSSALGSERAMKSLIAALDLSQEEVEERLRVVSMQPSVDSRYSSIFRELEEEIALTKAFPNTPSGPSIHH